MPYTMLVDNGSPWGNDLDHPFTPLTAWLIQLGVRVVHSRPYHPQTLGKLERFHRSLKAELLAGRTYTDLARCQAAFDRWRDFYNLERPHHALDLDTPASRYTISQRSFPETLPIVEYDTDDEVRTVDFNGRISHYNRWCLEHLLLSTTCRLYRSQPVECVTHLPEQLLPFSPVCTRGRTKEGACPSGLPTLIPTVPPS